MNIEAKPLSFFSLIGISDKTMAIHHDKLYVGYVNKLNEISEKLGAALDTGSGLEVANQTYSDLRALLDGETFAANGVYLHEYYFNGLGGTGEEKGELVEALKETHGSLEKFKAFFSATGVAVRGWAVLAWDTQAQKLKIYGSDSHAHGGVWGCLPILVLDVYEHAYFIDEGADRKTYIEHWWKNVDWNKANELYLKAKQ